MELWGAQNWLALSAMTDKARNPRDLKDEDLSRGPKRAATNFPSSFDFVLESLLNAVHLEDKVASGERIAQSTVNKLDSRGGPSVFLAARSAVCVFLLPLQKSVVHCSDLKRFSATSALVVVLQPFFRFSSPPAK